MDKKESFALAKRYADLVAEELNLDKIVLYGSSINGSSTDESDIDVAVIYENFIGDWLNTYRRIATLRRTISLLIEPILLDSAHDGSGFIREVLSRGEILFEKQIQGNT